MLSLATIDEIVGKIIDLLEGKKYVAFRVIYGTADLRLALKTLIDIQSRKKPIENVASLLDVQGIDPTDKDFIRKIDSSIVLTTTTGNERDIRQGERVYFVDDLPILCIRREYEPSKYKFVFWWFTNENNGGE